MESIRTGACSDYQVEVTVHMDRGLVIVALATAHAIKSPPSFSFLLNSPGFQTLSLGHAFQDQFSPSSLAIWRAF